MKLRLFVSIARSHISFNAADCFPTILYKLPRLATPHPAKMERRSYVFCIQLSKSVAGFQPDASLFLFKETNHVFSFAPGHCGEVLPNAAIAGFCDSGVHTMARIFVCAGCSLSAGAAVAGASSRQAAGGTSSGLLQAQPVLPSRPAAICAKGVGAAGPG